MARVGDRYSVLHVHAAAVGAKLHHRADVFDRQHEIHPHDRLAKFFDLAGVGHLLRIVNLQRLAGAW